MKRINSHDVYDYLIRYYEAKSRALVCASIATTMLVIFLFILKINGVLK